MLGSCQHISKLTNKKLNYYYSFFLQKPETYNRYRIEIYNL